MHWLFCTAYLFSAGLSMIFAGVDAFALSIKYEVAYSLGGVLRDSQVPTSNIPTMAL